MLKTITTRSTNVTPTIDKESRRKEDEKEMKIKMGGQASFLPHPARLAFIQLRQAFTQASILYYFEPGGHICIETDALGYAISRVLSQLTLNQQFSDA